MAVIFAMSNIWFSDHRVWCDMTVLDDERNCLKSGIHQKPYTPCEDLNLANQNNRKYLAGSWRKLLKIVLIF